MIFSLKNTKSNRSCNILLYYIHILKRLYTYFQNIFISAATTFLFALIFKNIVY